MHLQVQSDDTLVSINDDGVGTDFVEVVMLQTTSGLMLDAMLAQGNLLLA